MTARVVESVESHVFSWSRSRFFLNCWSRESGFQKFWSRSRFFKTAGVDFSKLLESESGVGILKNRPTPQPCSLVTLGAASTLGAVKLQFFNSSGG